MTYLITTAEALYDLEKSDELVSAKSCYESFKKAQAVGITTKADDDLKKFYSLHSVEACSRAMEIYDGRQLL